MWDDDYCDRVAFGGAVGRVRQVVGHERLVHWQPGLGRTNLCTERKSVRICLFAKPIAARWVARFRGFSWDPRVPDLLFHSMDEHTRDYSLSAGSYFLSGKRSSKILIRLLGDVP
jgi:hypothetical protein